MFRSLVFLAIGSVVLASGCSVFKKRCDEPNPAMVGAAPCQNCPPGSGQAVYPAPSGGYVPPTLQSGPPPGYPPTR